MLWGLLALPVIWWLLRLTPPRPQTEVFPPLKILARVLQPRGDAAPKPMVADLLRLLMAALVVLALAEPVFNPRETLPAAGAGLALVIDNGWASAADWEQRVATAERLIDDAGSTACLSSSPSPPKSPMPRSARSMPRPPGTGCAPRSRARCPPTALPSMPAWPQALVSLPGASVAVLADGLATPADRDAFDTCCRQRRQEPGLGCPGPARRDRPDRRRQPGRRFRAEGDARARRPAPRAGHRRRL